MFFAKLEELSEKEKKGILYRETISLDSVIQDTIQPIYEEILEDTIGTLKKYNQKWDHCSPDPLILRRDRLRIAAKNVQRKSPKLWNAFEEAARNIKKFHERQKPDGFEIKIQDNTLGYKFQPFDAVALYVPGGKALYPSTVLMGSLPASIAGVEDISIISPPNPDDNAVPDVVQAAAYMGGASRLIQAGGAHSILAMTTTIPEYGLLPVDFIYGPGNRYVSAAKSFVASRNLCGIDTYAGPSEILIIADSSANPRYLAHDLLAQAEHDEDATAILLCTDEKIASQAIDEMTQTINQTIKNKDSKRKKITRSSIERNGKVLLVDTLEEAIEFSNQFAPEHLEIQTMINEDVFKKIRAAGSVFLGDYAPVAIGDYYSGTNHILPTNRTARFSSGISVHSFFRRITYQKCSAEGLQKATDPISLISKAEGLFEEHGYSVLVRFE